MYILKYIKKNKMKQTFLLTFLSMALFFMAAGKIATITGSAGSKYFRCIEIECLSSGW